MVANQPLNAVLDEILAGLAPIRVTGTEPRDRIASLVRGARRDFLDGMHTLTLANEVGRGNELSFRTQVALADELARAGLDGAEAADVLRSLLFVVGGFVVIEDQYRQGVEWRLRHRRPAGRSRRPRGGARHPHGHGAGPPTPTPSSTSPSTACLTRSSRRTDGDRPRLGRGSSGSPVPSDLALKAMNVLHRAIDDVLGDNVVELYRRVAG